MKNKNNKHITSRILLLLLILVIANVITSCTQKEKDATSETKEAAMATLEKEIELRLRDFENFLKEGDSIALGDLYTLDAEIIPSLKGRDAIVRNFGSMIHDSITGSSFTTVGLWGNDQLLVEQGEGAWMHENGKVVGRGTYLLVWKKEDGAWKILRDTWFPERK